MWVQALKDTEKATTAAERLAIYSRVPGALALLLRGTHAVGDAVRWVVPVALFSLRFAQPFCGLGTRGLVLMR